MSFISYAPNFEDVLLWRALRHVEHGFYIDLAPTAVRLGSSTWALYERGWRGLHLTPAPALARQLRAARPADVTLDGVAGAAAGGALRYQLDDGADGTADPALARQQRAAGREVRQREVAVHPLGALCAAHAGPAIHCLRLGGEGDAALAGLDLARWRPWVVLAAGPAPRRLLEHGYALAHEDGVQGYYVATERPEVGAALRLPPHPADAFQLCEDHPYSAPLAGWRARVDSAETAAREARTWAMAHVEEWKQKHHLSAEHALRAEQATAALALMTARAQQAEALLGPLTERAGAAEAMRDAMTASLSWRLTLPLRVAKLQAGRARRLARRAAGRVRGAALGAAKGVLRRAVQFVVARPKLSFFVRRQAARFPLLVRVLRRLAMRARAGGADAAQAAPAPELHQLPAAARQVYDDLRRSRHGAPRR